MSGPPHGIDSSLAGILSTIVVSVALGVLFLALLAWKFHWYPHLVFSRSWFPPVPSRNAAPLHPSLLHIFSTPVQSHEASGTISRSSTFDSALCSLPPATTDEDMHLRTIWTICKVIFTLTISAFCIAVPLFVVRVPNIPNSLTENDGISSLEKISILRLLRSYDTDDSHVTDAAWPRMVAVTILIIVIPILILIFIIKPEFDLTFQFRKSFLSLQSEDSHQIAWLPAQYSHGLIGLSETDILTVFADFGFGQKKNASSRGGRRGHSRERSRQGHSRERSRQFPDGTVYPISVNAVYALPLDYSVLEALEKQRDKAIESLEIAETQYLSAWKPHLDKPIQSKSTVDNLPDNTRTSSDHEHRKGRSFLNLTSNSRGSTADERSVVGPYGPSGAYQIDTGKSFLDTPALGLIPNEENASDPTEETSNPQNRPESVMTFQTNTEDFDRQSSGAPLSPLKVEPTRSTDEEHWTRVEVQPKPHSSELAQPQYHSSLRPVEKLMPKKLAKIYGRIREARAVLRKLNKEIAEEQENLLRNSAEGIDVTGWFLIGKGLENLSSVTLLQGQGKADIDFGSLKLGPKLRISEKITGICISMLVIGIFASFSIVPAGIFSAYGIRALEVLTFFRDPIVKGGLSLGLLRVTTSSLAYICGFLIAVYSIRRTAAIPRYPSKTLTKMRTMIWIFAMILCAAFIIPLVCISLLFSAPEIRSRLGVSGKMVIGSVAAGSFFLSILILLAFVVPMFWLLKPFNTIKRLNGVKIAKTPRQRFEALKPPSTLQPLIMFPLIFLCVVVCSTFAFVQPLVLAPSIAFVLSIMVLARFDLCYANIRGPQTGGILVLYCHLAIGVALGISPVLVSLHMLSCRLWGLFAGGVAGSVVMLLAIGIYAYWTLRTLRQSSSSEEMREVLKTLQNEISGTGGKRRTIVSEMMGGDKVHNSRVISPSRSSEVNNVSWADQLDLERLGHEPENPFSRDQRPVEIPSESEDLDAKTEPCRAGQTYDCGPPRILGLETADKESKASNAHLYPDIMTRRPPPVWLPSSPLSQEEAAHGSQYWNLQVLYERTLPLSMLTKQV